MNYRGRFAPSPTGELHAGSLVAALGSWLCSRHAGGRWLVRIDDIDPPREVPGSAQAILSALRAHGLESDEPVLYQSSREAAYREAFDRLRERGEVFPCWCSRSDLAAHGGIHRDGQCLTSPRDDRPPAWRLRVPDRDIVFDDALQGKQHQNLREEVGDFVIRRVEGYWSYHLACAVDDAFQGITGVVRGCDLLDSTPRQIFLQQRLGLPTPTYMHLPLVLRKDTGKLSKSTRDQPLDSRDPMPALRRALYFLGLGAIRGDRVNTLLDAALKRFEPDRIPRCHSQPWPGTDPVGCLS